jgi:hypothetical protein
MCDYSLHDVVSRPAKVGDNLVTTEFWNTATRGFSPAGQPKVAVCLLPGTEVAFESEVERKVARFQLSFFRREPEHFPSPLASTSRPSATMALWRKASRMTAKASWPAASFGLT